MICCHQNHCCDYCPCCGRYLGPWRPIYPYVYPWYYRRPIYPSPHVPYPLPIPPLYDANAAVQAGRVALGAR